MPFILVNLIMIVTVQINNEQDLPVLEKFLTGQGLKFEVDNDDDCG